MTSNSYHFPWKGVPEEYWSEWSELFAQFPTASLMHVQCPICGHKTLFQWYYLHSARPDSYSGHFSAGRGSGWQWCHSCFCYEHFQARVPLAWTSPFKVPLHHLGHIPESLEWARRNMTQKETLNLPEL